MVSTVSSPFFPRRDATATIAAGKQRPIIPNRRNGQANLFAKRLPPPPDPSLLQTQPYPHLMVAACARSRGRWQRWRRRSSGRFSSTSRIWQTGLRIDRRRKQQRAWRTLTARPRKPRHVRRRCYHHCSLRLSAPSPDCTRSPKCSTIQSS